MCQESIFSREVSTRGCEQTTHKVQRQIGSHTVVLRVRVSLRDRLRLYLAHTHTRLALHLVNDPETKLPPSCCHVLQTVNLAGSRISQERHLWCVHVGLMEILTTQRQLNPMGWAPRRNKKTVSWAPASIPPSFLTVSCDLTLWLLGLSAMMGSSCEPQAALFGYFVSDSKVSDTSGK